ncbi:MAG: hypothetical protein ABIE68_05080 [bacterium]
MNKKAISIIVGVVVLVALVSVYGWNEFSDNSTEGSVINSLQNEKADGENNETEELKLEISNANDYDEIHTKEFEIKGNVSIPSATVKINGSQSGVSESGDFGMVLELENGDNNIRIVAEYNESVVEKTLTLKGVFEEEKEVSAQTYSAPAVIQKEVKPDTNNEVSEQSNEKEDQTLKFANCEYEAKATGDRIYEDRLAAFKEQMPINYPELYKSTEELENECSQERFIQLCVNDKISWRDRDRIRIPEKAAVVIRKDADKAQDDYYNKCINW